MKRHFFTPVLLLLGLFFSIGLVSCDEKAPDLSKKERDPRIVGSWNFIGNPWLEIPPKDRVIEFKADGSCTGGISYPGGKRLYYTKKNSRLYIFVYGAGEEPSNKTYEVDYLIEGDHLFIWWTKEDLLTGRRDRAIAYERITTP